jgi:hypothetical protein
MRKADYADLHFTRENRIDLSKEEELISKLLMLKKELEEYYERIEYYKDGEKQSKKVTATETLISKIMLGSLGCVPAYDRFFIDGLRVEGIKGTKFQQEIVTKSVSVYSDSRECVKRNSNQFVRKR